MQTAFEVRRANAQYPGQVKKEAFKLKFSTSGEKAKDQEATKEGKTQLQLDEEASGMTVAQATKLAKAKWFAIAGVKPPPKKVDKDE